MTLFLFFPLRSKNLFSLVNTFYFGLCLPFQVLQIANRIFRIIDDKSSDKTIPESIKCSKTGFKMFRVNLEGN